MATSSKRPTGEKRKEKVDWATTPAFEVQDIKLSDHSYLDADNLNAFSIGIFTGLFKDDKDQVWTVTLEPEEIRRMYNHSSVTKSFKDMRLHNHFRMRPCGVDVKRCYQFLSSMDLLGKARIENAEGEMIEVQINEDLVFEALKLPKGNQLLPKRGSTQEVKAIFQLRHGQEHTFKDLIEKEVELPLRLFTQQFKHGRAVRYTQPHRTVARAFSLAAKKTANQPPHGTLLSWCTENCLLMQRRGHKARRC